MGLVVWQVDVVLRGMKEGEICQTSPHGRRNYYLKIACSIATEDRYSVIRCYFGLIQTTGPKDSYQEATRAIFNIAKLTQVTVCGIDKDKEGFSAIVIICNGGEEGMGGRSSPACCIADIDHLCAQSGSHYQE